MEVGDLMCFYGQFWPSLHVGSGSKSVRPYEIKYQLNHYDFCIYISFGAHQNLISLPFIYIFYFHFPKKTLSCWFKVFRRYIIVVVVVLLMVLHWAESNAKMWPLGALKSGWPWKGHPILGRGCGDSSASLHQRLILAWQPNHWTTHLAAIQQQQQHATQQQQQQQLGTNLLLPIAVVVVVMLPLLPFTSFVSRFVCEEEVEEEKKKDPGFSLCGGGCCRHSVAGAEVGENDAWLMTRILAVFQVNPCVDELWLTV